MKKILFTVFFFFLASLSAAFVSCADNSKPALISENFSTKGSPDAPITIIEFSDFECPACRDANVTIDQILKKYGDKIYFIYRYFPLAMHKNSYQAAVAAECAKRQGKFWAFHDHLYQNQFDWNGVMPISLSDRNNRFVDYAAKFGLNVPAFNACLNSPTAAQTIDASKKEGEDLKVSSTPTFFINGIRIVGRKSLEAEYETVIENILKKKK